jgi:hypothetical protein
LLGGISAWGVGGNSANGYRRGNKDDFAALKTAGVQLEGKIALAKYGGPFRGVKVKNAEANGMIGVVLFTDPGDDGPQETKGQKAYPGLYSLSYFLLQYANNL